MSRPAKHIYLDSFHAYEAENYGSIDISIGNFYCSSDVSEIADDDDIVLSSVTVSTDHLVSMIVGSLSREEICQLLKDLDSALVDAGHQPMQSTDNTKLRELVSSAAVALKGILVEVGEG